ncbi:MAG TPA: lysylphosphatidylglycerol synthase transmembrane domain-containing protein [Streptosporangiaceae bacterium]|nr:lysylphosphatidylglycerol synthase transmembrane domain-containing protein [Streptosporangiaceae bacterium]
MAGPFENPDHPRSRGRGRSLRELVRYAIGICLGIAVLLLLFGKRGELAGAWHQVTEADPRWLLGALGAEVASLASFAWLQHRVLKLSGASISVRETAALTLANHAIANTVPGEPVVSSAYRYRYCRRHGVSRASAGWTIFTMLVAQAIAMSLILLLGVLVALLAGTGVLDTGVTISGLVIIGAAGTVLVRRDLILRLAGALPRGLRRVTGHRYATVETMTARVEATFAKMRQIPLRTRSAVSVVVIAALVWLADLGCLIFAFGAVRADVPWDGVLLAYGVAQVAGSLPVVPGGIGIIEGSLAVVLISYGTDPVPALATALVYRIIAFWLESAVGWVAVGVIAHRARRSAAEKPELSQAPACAGESPSQRDSSAVPIPATIRQRRGDAG